VHYDVLRDAQAAPPTQQRLCNDVCRSVLAAPVVLTSARFADRAMIAGDALDPFGDADRRVALQRTGVVSFTHHVPSAVRFPPPRRPDSVRDGGV
jgi:hypothetical protein